jgi:hypothetical protein
MHRLGDAAGKDAVCPELSLLTARKLIASTGIS